MCFFRSQHFSNYTYSIINLPVRLIKLEWNADKSQILL
jgi:hypothetical protein